MENVTKVDLGLFKVVSADMNGAFDLVDQMRTSGELHYVCFAESNILYHARRNEAVVKALNDADAVFADGVAVDRLASIHGSRLPSRVTGPGFFLKSCELGVEKGWKHYFYGGSEGIADKLRTKMQEQFPGIQIVGTDCPPFRELTENEVLESFRKVQESEADVVWVALGGPKQELWMNKYRDMLTAPVLLGVGAAFDFHTGNRKWAPKLIRKVGLEWMYRMVTGGRKTLFRNIRCVTDTAWFLTTEFCKVRVFGKRTSKGKKEPTQVD